MPVRCATPHRGFAAGLWIRRASAAAVEDVPTKGCRVVADMQTGLYLPRVRQGFALGEPHPGRRECDDLEIHFLCCVLLPRQEQRTHSEGTFMHSVWWGEFMGTLVLVLLGNGVSAGVTLRKSYAADAGWMVI